jgi:hypothetical protein
MDYDTHETVITTDDGQELSVTVHYSVYDGGDYREVEVSSVELPDGTREHPADLTDETELARQVERELTAEAEFVLWAYEA